MSGSRERRRRPPKRSGTCTRSPTVRASSRILSGPKSSSSRGASRLPKNRLRSPHPEGAEARKIVFRNPVLGYVVIPGVVHAHFHLPDGLLDELDRLLTMASLVWLGRLELASSRRQVIEGQLHARLGGGTAGGEGDPEGSTDRGKGENSGMLRDLPKGPHGPPQCVRSNWTPRSTCPIASLTRRSALVRWPPLSCSALCSSDRAARRCSSAARMCG